MIVEKVLGNIHQAPPSEQIVRVPFAWFETEKKRIAAKAEDGTEMGISAGGGLKDGDILAKTDDKVYVVAVQPSHVIQIKVSTMQEMGRLCFELGNRHLSLKIEPNCVTVPYDEPTYLYLKKLGFDAQELHAVFSDFIECKAHGASVHSHTHSHGQEHHHE